MKSPCVIDIGTELAEGFDLPPGGLPVSFLNGLTLPDNGRGFHRRHGLDRFDEQVLPVITSAHLACGLHSGDPLVIRRIVGALVERGVQLGAHPSYPDVFNFGQDRVDLSHDDLVAVLLYQFGGLQGVLAQFDQRILHVKCHGALAFDAAYEDWACDALIEAIRIFDPAMVLVAMAGSPSIERARAAGIRVVAEGFIDRGYDSNGRLVPRSHPKALIQDPEDGARQVIAMARDGYVTAVDGTRVPLSARSFCLHSDTPSADVFAPAFIAAIKKEGIDIKPLGELAA